MILSRLLVLSLAAAGLSLTAAAATVFSASGSIAGITPTVNAFRAALGTLNPPGACAPTPCTSGRREINWDAVPAASFNPFPGGFFNAGGSPAGRTRGLSMTSAGTMQVSATSFGFPADFPPFSNDKIFGAVGSNEIDIFFHVPGQPSTTAGTMGMGIVFIDAELPGTVMSFFDVFTNLSLGTFAVPTGASGDFNFLGVTFDPGQVGRVHVVFGDTDTLNCSFDCVAMDDFIYGEPLLVPEPSSVLLSAAGLVLLLAGMRRRRQGHNTSGR
jgi:hypothetical protein